MKPKQKKDYDAAVGRWPDFGRFVAGLFGNAPNPKQRYVLPHELWPVRPAHLLPPAKKFLDDLLPVLDEAEVERLKKAEGKWPEFPQTLQELAARRGVKVSWHTLPGPPEMWDRYRSRVQAAGDRLPDRTGSLLTDFALLPRQTGGKGPPVSIPKRKRGFDFPR